MTLLPLRQAWPMGATPVPGGWNFVVFSSEGHAVDVCLFDREDHQREIARVRLPHRTGDLFHGAVSGLEAGQPYGLRVHGPWQPMRGQFFNPAKLLLDPYAMAVSGQVLGHEQQRTCRQVSTGVLEPDPIDSASVMPRSLLAEPPPRVEWTESPLCDVSDLVIYEMHIGGFSGLAPHLPEELRGTYAGLGHEQSIAYLKELGITAVQLMPVHLRVDDLFLRERGLSNWWGYQPINFFTPDPRFCATDDPLGAVVEVREMVSRLHEAGLEVILDVVYNHSGEHGATGGFSLCYRGLDSNAYYRQPADNLAADQDFTGTGNTLDTSHPRTLQLVMDSMRFWVERIGVDGFRFDLAATLGRDAAGRFGHRTALFNAMSQDPVLARARLIAEPWDIGPFGYQVGGFPPGWQELNGKFRDCVRRFWKGDGGMLGEFAGRVTGSEDLYGSRGPNASVNFITSHDGFTLRDLVSYNHKHNEANCEDNRDGESHNESWNCGVEGPTDNPEVLALRRRQKRNLLVTLLLSQGVPFLLMGDERNRTQGGNNNSYCQSGENFWMSWDDEGEEGALRRFVTGLLDLRQQHFSFRRRRFLHGNQIAGSRARDALWVDEQGQLMTPAQWRDPERRQLGLLLAGISATSKHRWRHSAIDPCFLALLSAADRPIDFVLPGVPSTVRWKPVVDTSARHGLVDYDDDMAAGERVPLLSRHLILFRQETGSQEDAQVPASRLELAIPESVAGEPGVEIGPAPGAGRQLPR